MCATATVILSPWLGLVKAEWAPDARTVVCFSDWGVSILAVCKLHIKNAISCSCVCLYGLLRRELLHISNFLSILTKVRLLLQLRHSV